MPRVAATATSQAADKKPNILVVWGDDIGNRPDDPQDILSLIGEVITVSLETVKTVKALPPLSEIPVIEP